jgi:Flp pilus assembly protein TadG
MSSPAQQRGAVAIEFALVLGLFIALLYAIISYAFVFMFIQCFTYASEDGLRAAIAVDCVGLTSTQCRDNRIAPAVRAQAVNSLSWLPAQVAAKVLGTNGANVDVNCDSSSCEAVISYDNYRDSPILPIITLPVIGDVPRLPQDLVGRARLHM